MGFSIDGTPAVSDGVALTRAVREWVVADRLRFVCIVVPSYLAALKTLTIPLHR